jgi:hypothetical protein
MFTHFTSGTIGWISVNTLAASSISWQIKFTVHQLCPVKSWSLPSHPFSLAFCLFLMCVTCPTHLVVLVCSTSVSKEKWSAQQPTPQKRGRAVNVWAVKIQHPDSMVAFRTAAATEYFMSENQLIVVTRYRSFSQDSTLLVFSFMSHH